jgi:hypothetical protein
MKRSRRSTLPPCDYEGSLGLEIQTYSFFLKMEGKDPCDPKNWEAFYRSLKESLKSPDNSV